jgi:uroporphyrinogen-III synthase
MCSCYWGSASITQQQWALGQGRRSGVSTTLAPSALKSLVEVVEDQPALWYSRTRVTIVGRQTKESIRAFSSTQARYETLA